MYRVMIVDDEQYIRDGIKNSINWKAHDVSDVMTASGGEEAIALMKEFSPHLILCDIMMDDMDGFEVIKRIKEIDQACKVIFLTGHDDFKFAQRALRLGAFDYLLKISSAEEIIKVVKKGIREIQEEAKQQESYDKLKQDVEEYSPLLRDKYMTMFVQGGENNYEENDVGNVYATLKSTLEISYFMVVAFRPAFKNKGLDKSENDHKLTEFQRELTSWSDVRINEKGMMFQNAAGDFIIINAFPDVDDREILEKIFVGDCCDLKNRLIQEMDIGLAVGISDPHKAYTQIKMSYDEAIEALDYYPLNQRACVLYEDVHSYNKISPTISMVDEKSLMAALKGYELKKMGRLIDKIYGQFEASTLVERREVIDFSLVLYGFLSKVILELKVDVSSLFNDQSFYNRLLQSSDYLSIKDGIHNLFNNTSKIISETHVHGITDNVQFVCDYIENHFEEDITLESVSKMIHLSPSHFSHMFSKETGMNFLQFLTNCRIEKAKLMLMDKNYKTYEVGESVGYPNPHYFSRIFKKYTGIPPTKYRENMLKTNKITQKESND